ncbi:transposase, partial [Limosilactobacillus fermentum]
SYLLHFNCKFVALKTKKILSTNHHYGNPSTRFSVEPYKQGESAAQLAREYGIGYSTVHKWIQGQAKTQSGKSPDEIKAMEKRLASLSEENEILKKALGFLAQK